MSFSTGCRKCQKCGKIYLINLFDGGLCAECEKTEQDDMPCITPEEMQKCKDIVKKYTPEQEPCDDVISRENAIIQISWDFPTLELPKIKESLDKLPSVRPQEQTGHWIKLYMSDTGEVKYECSVCGFIASGKWKYCCECGARMESERMNENSN